MLLTITAENAEIEGAGRYEVSVTLHGVDVEKLAEQLDTEVRLKGISAEVILEYLENPEEFMDAIGEDACRKHFGIAE